MRRTAGMVSRVPGASLLRCSRRRPKGREGTAAKKKAQGPHTRTVGLEIGNVCYHSVNWICRETAVF